MAAQLVKTSLRTAAPSRVSRSRRLRVQASEVPANVAEARAWIDAWRNKKAVASSRPSWFPGSAFPAHLDGTLAGDFGFDPLGLGTEPANLKWYVQAELMNGRWAMLGTAGILFPELLSKIGFSWPGAGVAWYDAGKFEYFAPSATLFAIELTLFAWIEGRRYQDFMNPGSANTDPIFTSNKLPDEGVPGYPGGIFDPFGWSKGDLATLKIKEIKNGRLAMLSIAGYFAQYITTGKTPLTNLADHLADPFNTTVWSNDLARL